jgi:hypothetical protein
MANKEQRSSREKRKPKKEKPKPAQNVSSFSAATSKSSTAKKARLTRGGIAVPQAALPRLPQAHAWTVSLRLICESHLCRFKSSLSFVHSCQLWISKFFVVLHAPAHRR